jgi:excisionase family DNA binding protein
MDKIFLTFIEAAQFLRLSKPTVERFVAEGKIPSYKVGKRRLFDRDELIEWVKSHRNGPTEKTVRSIKKPRQRKP